MPNQTESLDKQLKERLSALENMLANAGEKRGPGRPRKQEYDE